MKQLPLALCLLVSSAAAAGVVVSPVAPQQAPAPPHAPPQTPAQRERPQPKREADPQETTAAKKKDAQKDEKTETKDATKEATKDAQKDEKTETKDATKDAQKDAQKDAKKDAQAAQKAALDFVFVHESGEASRDSSHHETTWTVQGTKARYTYRSSGRDGGMPHTQDKDVDGVLSDPAAIAALLDAFDKTPTTSKMPKRIQDTRYETACIRRGADKKSERCIGLLGGRNWDAPRPADFAALDALMAALMEQVKVPL